MKSISWLMLFLMLGAFVLSPVRAEDAVDEDVDVTEDEGEEYEEMDEEYEEDMPDVTTTVYFPDHPEKRFLAGEEVTVLIDFQNKGDEDYNVSAIGAFLHSPFDYNYYIQNFTAKFASANVPPGAQVSLEYKFKPDQSLEPLEFWLSGFVEYNNSDDQIFYSTFVNGTVELYEEATAANLSTFVQYFLVLAGVGVVSYIALNLLASKAGGKKKRKRAAVSESTSDDWDVDTYKQSDKQRSAGRRKGGKASGRK